MRRILLGLLLGALIFGVAFAGAKVVTVTNPLSATLDVAGHEIYLNGGQIQGPGVIGNLDVLNSKMVVVRSDNPVSFTSGAADPSVTPGNPQPIGSLYVRSDQSAGVAQVWQKTGQADTDWTQRF